MGNSSITPRRPTNRTIESSARCTGDIARCSPSRYQSQTSDAPLAAKRGVNCERVEDRTSDDRSLVTAIHSRKQCHSAVDPNPLPGNSGGEVDGDLLHAEKLTIPEAAMVLGIGETKLRGMIQHGELPVLLVGGKAMILARDLETYLRGHYGVMQPAPKTASRLPELPEYVLNSELMQHVR